MIEKVELFHILTDTDSTSLKFIFIPDQAITIPESKYRDILFQGITSTDIYKRFDSSHPFWEIFNVRNKHKKKKLVYYEIKNIDNPYILTLAVSQKQY